MSESMTDTVEISEAEVIINLLRTTRLRIGRYLQNPVDLKEVREMQREAKGLLANINARPEVKAQ